MDVIYFPGNKVLNLFPHWVDESYSQLVPLNALGTVLGIHNDLVTVRWNYLDKDQKPSTVNTEILKTSIKLIALVA